MTLIEALDSRKAAPAEPTRESTIRQVMDWCQAQEAVALRKPGREITLVVARDYC